MSTDLLFDLTVFILALLVGFEVISKVPATLHTPLMSGANSIHGIVVVGAMLLFTTAHGWVAYVAIALGIALLGRRGPGSRHVAKSAPSSSSRHAIVSTVPTRSFHASSNAAASLACRYHGPAPK